MNRDNLIRVAMVLAVVAALLLCLAWLYTATEWVSEHEEGQATGEALTNRLYATQSVLRVLGAKVIQRETMEHMPPPQATLVLTSTYWDLFPDNMARLRQWVQGGGHLVIHSYLAEQEKFKSWVQVSEVEAPKNTGKSAPQKPIAAPRWAAGDLLNSDKCRDVVESWGTVDVALPERSFRLCSMRSPALTSPHKPQWQLEGPYGPEAMRVAVGQGAVTVAPLGTYIYQRNVLDADHAQMVLAALRVQPAGEVWFVVNEKRAPLLAWLWTAAWPAVLAGLLALGVALWRNGARFGPWVPDRALGRRSVAEQVRGTAQFLRKKGSAALHQAQARALEEMALRHIPGFRTMHMTARAQAIGQFADLSGIALARALDLGLRRTPHDVQASLQLLELARRRVRERVARSRAAPSSSSPFVDSDQKEDHAN